MGEPLGRTGFNIILTFILFSFIFAIIISRKEKYDLVFIAFTTTFIIIYFFIYWRYSVLPRYFNTPNILKKRKAQLSDAIDRLSIIRRVPDESIPDNKMQLINWRPMTVRLSGYLGGRNYVANGVFEMKQGIIHAIKLGARAFVFEIDYLDKRPCEPLLMYRDEKKIMRSLNQGSLKEGIETLRLNAFSRNLNDPVLIILYLRRIPPKPDQKKKFLSAIAKSMSDARLDLSLLNAVGGLEFKRHTNEDKLFLNVSINQVQKNFIVLINYNTTNDDPLNLETNLDMWIHCRIWQDNNSRQVGITPQLPASGATKHAQIGFSDDHLSSLTEPTSLDQKQTETRHIFTISLGPVDKSYTTSEVQQLLNTGGIQCVPMDVLGYGESGKHLNTLNSTEVPQDKSEPTNPEDPLSFWRFGGWSIKPRPLQRSSEEATPVFPPPSPIPSLNYGSGGQTS